MSSRRESAGPAQPLTSDIERDENQPPHRGMAIVEKYEQLINYLYPILQNCPRKEADHADQYQG